MSDVNRGHLFTRPHVDKGQLLIKTAKTFQALSLKLKYKILIAKVGWNK